MPYKDEVNEQILDYIRRRLNDSKGEWRKIADITGVPYDTVAKIAQGKRPNPTLDNVQPLLNYFAELDAMIDRLRPGPEVKAVTS